MLETLEKRNSWAVTMTQAYIHTEISTISLNNFPADKNKSTFLTVVTKQLQSC